MGSTWGTVYQSTNGDSMPIPAITPCPEADCDDWVERMGRNASRSRADLLLNKVNPPTVTIEGEVARPG